MPLTREFIYFILRFYADLIFPNFYKKKKKRRTKQKKKIGCMLNHYRVLTVQHWHVWHSSSSFSSDGWVVVVCVRYSSSSLQALPLVLFTTLHFFFFLLLFLPLSFSWECLHLSRWFSNGCFPVASLNHFRGARRRHCRRRRGPLVFQSGNDVREVKKKTLNSRWNYWMV